MLYMFVLRTAKLVPSLNKCSKYVYTESVGEMCRSVIPIMVVCVLSPLMSKSLL